tara:strand:- start:1472 stop:2155 length:684 start_codon:yes stop_codon:yes gene_type:complete
MNDYIKKSHKNNLQERKEYTVFGSVNLFIKDPLPRDIDVSSIIMDLEDTIPRKFFHEIDIVLVGQIPELIDRGLRGAYLDGGIYITNEQPSDEQMFEDIVHEIAHAVEKTYEFELYGDGNIEREYTSKKITFLNLMHANGISVPNRIKYENEYSKAFDEFLYYTLGYEKVEKFSNGLFISPYAPVSISEYFATAFEAYFVNTQQEYVKKISPYLYEKIREITKEEEI